MMLDLKHAGKVLVMGDVMLDQYWYGHAQRLSPEAPVPVVKVSQQVSAAGGAANVALNLVHLEIPTTLVGYCGNDTAGAQLQALLEQPYLTTHLLESKAPTIVKLRLVGGVQQLLRVDHEEHYPSLQTRAQELAINWSDYKVLVLSDYGKGSLMPCLEWIQVARDAGVKVVVDPKSNDFSDYAGATLLTPNLKEFELVFGPVKDWEQTQAQVSAFLEAHNIEAILVTQGAQGMSLLTKNAPRIHLLATALEVFDITGAGDTVIATLAACLAADLSLPTAMEYANLAAGLVVAKRGTATVSRQELQWHSVQRKGVRILDGKDAQAWSRAQHAQGKKIVFTNGCFDLLHPGHIRYLEAARALGDVLVIGVNTDASIARLKGPTRPIQPLAVRLELLAALRCVDQVVAFDEDTPEALITHIEPDILVKGGDYTPASVVGAAFVESRGGQVCILPFVDGYSSTKLISKIAVKGSQEVAV